MRVFIDIGHPAHVHYFRNFIKIMEARGHQFCITARNKEVSFQLLDFHKIPYISRGSGKKSLFGKMLYLLKADLKLLKIARKFKPDVFLSFSSPYLAQVSKLMGKPHIAFDDTEHAKLEQLLYVPLTNAILTPNAYTKNLSENQIRFDGYMELLYLYPTRYQAKKDVLNELGLCETDKYVVMRFISWDASHDFGQKGISLETKKKIISELSKYCKVLISSEKVLPPELMKYRFSLSPEKMHDVLANASLLISEGPTMVSECACLGVPSIFVTPLKVGYCTEEEEKYNLVFGYDNSDGVLEKAVEIINNFSKADWQKRREKMLAEKIDVTAFTIWFVENYPNSIKIMKENPNYQYNFK